ncbi:ChaN family lipoprotein [candidate division KSB1 bacterium]|nr:ChaN family lipoprotein [candidate division KSB1 bacterium]
MKITNAVLIFLLLLMSALFAEENQFNTDMLPIGNPNTKFDFCAVKLNKIFDTNNKSDLAVEDFINKIKDYRVIMVGESHTSETNHQVQLEIIKKLIEAGQTVCLALEMFNPAQNEALNNYASGKTNEEEFLEEVDYFNTWGHNYRYYKPIFDYARENKLKMYGVNIEHKYASKIGRSGLKSLTEEEQKKIPEIDTSNVEHRFFFKVAMEGMDATMPAPVFNKIYTAQCLWDAAMGNGAIKAAHENPESNVVLLAGSGHVVYNLGIGKIIKNRSNLSFTSVVCVDVPDTVKESLMMRVKKSIKKEKEKTGESKEAPPKMKKPKIPPMGMKHGMGSPIPHKIVIRSLADFLWGIPEEKHEKYPSFGFSINKKEETGFKVKRVIPETIAEEQGIKRGDVILSVDGKEFEKMADLKKHLHFKNWKDSIKFEILRKEEKVEIEFLIEQEKEK